MSNTRLLHLLLISWPRHVKLLSLCCLYSASTPVSPWGILFPWQLPPRAAGQSLRHHKQQQQPLRRTHSEDETLTASVGCGVLASDCDQSIHLLRLTPPWLAASEDISLDACRLPLEHATGARADAEEEGGRDVGCDDKNGQLLARSHALASVNIFIRRG